MSKNEFKLFIYLQHFRNPNLPEERVVPQIPSVQPNGFTKEVYFSIIFFAGEIRKCVEQFKTNSFLLKEMNNNPAKIIECINYDMIQIFGMLYGADYTDSDRNLESFCCFLLLPNANSEIIHKTDYDQLQSYFKTGKYKKNIEETFFYYFNKDNPLFLTFIDAASDHRTSLALPFLLNRIDNLYSIENSLFSKYGDLLSNYAELLVKVDGIADIVEQNNLIQINKIIYETN